jgi:phosphomannomutase
MITKCLIWYDEINMIWCVITFLIFSLQANDIRKDFIVALQNKFAQLNLKYSVGGQISFDVFPQGWDKTYCLNHLPAGDFDEIHFFGDKTFEGKNSSL